MQPGEQVDRLQTGWSGLDRTIGLPWLVALATAVRARQRNRDLHVQDVLDVVRRQADLVVGAVEHQVPVVRDEVQEVERLDGDLGVLDGRHVEGGNDEALVGLVERVEDLVVEARRGVDDDVVEVDGAGSGSPGARARR